MVLAPQSSAGRTRIGGKERADSGDRPARRDRRRVSNTVLMLGLAAVVATFVGIVIPKYLTFDTALGRLPASKYPYYFPLLMTHVLTAAIAITTCVLQVWPWLRRRHPRVHRWVGSVYTVCVFPASISVIVISLLWGYHPVAGTSDILHALAWMIATAVAYVYVRKGEYFYHRRWMLRSFVLAVSNILNRVVGFAIQAVLAMQLDSTFGGDSEALKQAVVAIDSWLCWTVSLIALEWWMDRDFRRSGPGRRAVAAANGRLGALRTFDDRAAVGPTRSNGSMTSTPAESK
jgi:uncharacterized membrane protein YozB (DUF420 family)